MLKWNLWKITRRTPISTTCAIRSPACESWNALWTALEPKLGAIQVPALVIQGQGDPVVNPKGSVRVFQRLGSEDKTYILFSFNRHGIVRGEGAERVHRAVWEFIERLN